MRRLPQRCRELGIDGLTDECIKELEASEMEYPAGAEIDRALVLLSHGRMGRNRPGNMGVDAQ